MMTAIADHHSLEQVASVTSIPLYLVRATARDLIDARLINERDGLYYLTDLGTEKLELTGKTPAES
jgi:methylglyoxal synthase